MMKGILYRPSYSPRGISFSFSVNWSQENDASSEVAFPYFTWIQLRDQAEKLQELRSELSSRKKQPYYRE